MIKPRLLLIFCEGVTEKLYFDSLIQHKRVYTVLPIEVFGKEGQHKSLIKKCVAKRKKKAKEFELNENNIEVWAVCDCDEMKIKYQELLRYSRERNVNLAFSNPQFETYLIQHFETKRTKNERSALISELETYLGKKYDKSNLSWFDEMIDKDPTRLDFAISNSNKLKNHTKLPFLTVQELTARLLEFAK
jgi:hypothetical protein